MPEVENQSAVSRALAPGHSFVSSVCFSERFMRLLRCPAKTISLSFQIEAGGLLRCRAEHHTDVVDEVAVKEWEIILPRTSTFYKLITGEIA